MAVEHLLSERSRLLAVTFGLSIAVAHGDDGRPVQTDAWVYDQIANANRLFSPADVSFRWVLEPTAGPRAAHMETREDRDALGNEPLEPRVINVTIVGTLRDVDDPERMRMGVCWQNRDDPARRYLIVAATAKPTVLAHELGHFFGNAHTTIPNNLMSYERTDPAAIAFDARQIARVRAHTVTFLASGALVDELPARGWP